MTTNKPKQKVQRPKDTSPKQKKTDKKNGSVKRLTAIFTLIAVIVTIIVAVIGISKTNAETQQTENNVAAYATSVIETATAKIEANAHATSTHEVIFTSVAGTETAIADEFDFTPKYFCSNTAYIDTTTDNPLLPVKKWAENFRLSAAQPIKTSYWSRVADMPNHEYLFIAFINRGTPVKLSEFTNPIWELDDFEPNGWDERSEIIRQEEMMAATAYVLLVADRDAQFSTSVFPSLPQNPSDNPSLPSDNPQLPNDSFSSSPQNSNLFFDCGELMNWGIQQVGFVLHLDPDRLPIFPYPIILVEGDRSISQLLEPQQ